MNSIRQTLSPTVIFIGTILLLIPLSLIQINWETWRIATCMPDTCFCEQLDPGTVRQPVNAWSSLAFYFLGLIVFFQVKSGSSDQEKSLIFHPMFGYTYAFSLAVVGLGSAFFHASLTFVGQFIDVAGMYLATTFMLAYAWNRLYKLSTSATKTIYLLMNLILAVVLIVLPETRRYVFAIILVLAIIFEFVLLGKKRPEIDARWLRASLALFALVYFIWILDNQHILCVPESTFQGHAIWHIGGAIAAWWLFVYYRSEKTSPKQRSGF